MENWAEASSCSWQRVFSYMIAPEYIHATKRIFEMVLWYCSLYPRKKLLPTFNNDAVPGMGQIATHDIHETTNGIHLCTLGGLNILARWHRPQQKNITK